MRPGDGENESPYEAVVLAAAELPALFDALHARGYTVVGRRSRRGDRARRVGFGGRAAVRLGCHPGGRALPAAPPGRHGRVRPLGGPAVVEELPAPAPGPGCGRRTGRRWARDGQPSRWPEERAPVRLPRGAPVRPAARSASWTGCCRRGHADPIYIGRRDGAFVIAVECTEPGATCFCTSMGDRPGRRTRVRPRPDGAGRRRRRRRRPPVPGPGRHAGRRRRAGRRAAAGPADEATVRTPAGAVAERPRRMGTRDARRQPAGPAAPRSRESAALGRRRLPLPDLRQLHHGLPDLLLHHHRGRHRPHRRPRRAVAASGTPATTWTSPTCTAAACGPAGRAGTGSGSATSSAPGTTSSARPAASAAAAASSGARPASTSPRRWPPCRRCRPGGSGRAGHGGLSRLVRRGVGRHPFCRGLTGATSVALWPARTCTVDAAAPGERIFAEGGAADRFWLIESGSVALDMRVPGRGTRCSRRCSARHRAGLVVAASAVPLAVRRGRPRSRPRPSRSTPRRCGDAATPIPPSGTRCCACFTAGHRPSGCRPPGCGCWTCTARPRRGPGRASCR